jgi:hypothetical protein
MILGPIPLTTLGLHFTFYKKKNAIVIIFAELQEFFGDEGSFGNHNILYGRN